MFTVSAARPMIGSAVNALAASAPPPVLRRNSRRPCRFDIVRDAATSVTEAPRSFFMSFSSRCATRYSFLSVRLLVLGTLVQIKDRKSTRLNSSHQIISYAVFCLKKKKKTHQVLQNAVQPTTDVDTHNPTL